eukprot:scaffold133023_cov32-Tisochrysis_lutea.AAC.2
MQTVMRPRWRGGIWCVGVTSCVCFGGHCASARPVVGAEPGRHREWLLGKLRSRLVEVDFRSSEVDALDALLLGAVTRTRNGQPGIRAAAYVTVRRYSPSAPRGV